MEPRGTLLVASSPQTAPLHTSRHVVYRWPRRIFTRMAEVNIDSKCFKQSVALFHSFPDGEFKIKTLKKSLWVIFAWLTATWANQREPCWLQLFLGSIQLHRIKNPSHTCPTVLFSVPEKDSLCTNEQKKKNNTTTSYRIWSRFAVCKPACFSDCPDPQSSVQQQIHHIDWAAEGAQTDECSLRLRSKLHFFFRLVAAFPIICTMHATVLIF